MTEPDNAIFARIQSEIDLATEIMLELLTYEPLWGVWEPRRLQDSTTQDPRYKGSWSCVNMAFRGLIDTGQIWLVEPKFRSGMSYSVVLA